MAKFNVVQKRRRAAIAEIKRAIKGDPGSRKLKIKPQTTTVSGKRQRKILKKWRRDQREALEKGLITMQDVEMAAAETEAEGAGTSNETTKTPPKFHVKKAVKLKQSKRKGKDKRKSETPAKASVDVMVE